MKKISLYKLLVTPLVGLVLVLNTACSSPPEPPEPYGKRIAINALPLPDAELKKPILVTSSQKKDEKEAEPVLVKEFYFDSSLQSRK